MNNMSDQTWSPPKDGVVKLKTGNEVRRIHVSRLLDPARQEFNFANLTLATCGYLSLSPFSSVSFVYKDEDGDDITIETEAEFLEAWEHVGGSVFRVTGKKSIRSVLRHSVTDTNQQNLTSSFVEIQKLFDAIIALMTNLFVMVQKKFTSHPSNSGLVTEPRVPSSASVEEQAEAFTKRVKEGAIAYRNLRKNQFPVTMFKPRRLCKKLDPNFVHARHTCDGCGVSPIVGLRYHATNRADFDFCGECFTNNKGNEKPSTLFEPQQLERDLIYQHCRKSSKKSLRKFKPKSHCANPNMVSSKVVPEQESKERTLGDERKAKSTATEELKDIENIIDNTIVSVNNFVSAVVTELGQETAFVKKEELDQKALTSPSTCNESPTNETENKGNETYEVDDDACKPVVNIIEDVSNGDEDDGIESVSGEENEIISEKEMDQNVIGNPNVDLVLSCASSHVSSTDENIVLIPEVNVIASCNSSYVSEKSSETSSSNGSWDIVKDDDAMARASSAIGSALFESEIGLSYDDLSVGESVTLSRRTVNKSPNSKSPEEISSSASSTSDSTNYSADTSLSEVLLYRWGKELEELEKMGFVNKVACVEALESLMAANIGCDRPNETVTLEQAVDYLLRSK